MGHGREDRDIRTTFQGQVPEVSRGPYIAHRGGAKESMRVGFGITTIFPDHQSSDHHPQVRFQRAAIRPFQSLSARHESCWHPFWILDFIPVLRIRKLVIMWNQNHQ